MIDIATMRLSQYLFNYCVQVRMGWEGNPSAPPPPPSLSLSIKHCILYACPYNYLFHDFRPTLVSMYRLYQSHDSELIKNRYRSALSLVNTSYVSLCPTEKLRPYSLEQTTLMSQPEARTCAAHTQPCHYRSAIHFTQTSLYHLFTRGEGNLISKGH